MDTRPPIVCLCGSIRFAEEMRVVARDLGLAGVVVLAPVVLDAADGPVTDEQRATLGALHLAKIDLADRVVVVNPGGYVGESTRREVRHAEQSGTQVTYTDAVRP